MAREEMAPLDLGNLPSRRPDLFSQYNHELCRKVAPRFMMLHAEAAHPPVIVRSEGASVLIRELEKTHLKNKAAAGHKRALQSAAQKRKQPRRHMQQHVEQQQGDEQHEQSQQLQEQPQQQRQQSQQPPQQPQQSSQQQQQQQQQQQLQQQQQQQMQQAELRLQQVPGYADDARVP
ncbi:hypothetical protein MNEG_12571 [Monoraphidium neglectum]|uniref:Uncharacterized protein n=1 Tax=Monoraphidium neglectum TaxID=145388 RepID=A0A0D2KHU1_9CHLO|nr:hypothetical protein MNEG_12571 [Monoraphidium neglectum]KIY95393.1 hypothetical protein MNEG_12571 [Monoraphidium neglectum]|eukprot:XP_013894413.1 hypothetical protein MNEG_12571 [Monoraphidium neglectum]